MESDTEEEISEEVIEVPEEEIITDMTRGKQTSSFRVVIPASIVKKAGFSKEEQFKVLYRVKKGILVLRKVTYEELLEV